MNDALIQGGDRFGSARLENGNIIITGVGDGDGFSVFYGESDDVYDYTGADPAIDSTANSPIGGLSATIGALTAETTGGAITNDPVAPHSATYTVGAGEAGLLDPIFYPEAGDMQTDMTISVKVNDVEVGVVRIPGSDYTGMSLEDRSFRLSSFPQVGEGDVVSYTFNSSITTGNFNYQTRLIDSNDSSNLTADDDGDGQVDLFQENAGPSADANAWQYENATNDTLNWYRVRQVPDFVSTSIEVFDAQGGSHVLEARFFRTGTKTEAGTGARINSWDMMLGIEQDAGVLVDDMIAGIEFDQDGRYNGNVGTSAQATAFNDTDYVGNPAVAECAD